MIETFVYEQEVRIEGIYLKSKKGASVGNKNNYHHEVINHKQKTYIVARK